MRRTLGLFLAGMLANAAQAADLLQVYRDALANDAQLAAARAQLIALQERLPQGRAGLLPTIGVSGNTTWNDVQSVTDRQYNGHGYTLQLTQPLFRWQNIVQYDQSKLQVAQAEAQFATTRQDLALRVTQAYFDVLLAQDTVGVLETQKTAVTEQLESAKKNFEVGTTTITDTHEAQARFDLTVAQLIAAQNDLEVKRQALRLIIGKEPEALKALRSGVQLQRPQPENMQKWVEAAESGAYAVQVQQLALDIATMEMDKTRAGHYPTVDAVATYGYSKSGTAVGVGAGGEVFTGAATTSSTIGLQLNLPIYQGGFVSSREREVAALRDKAFSDLESARRGAALAARQAYLGVTSGLSQVSALNQALVSSQSALESNKLGYEVGVRINIDVLNAQQQVTATRRDLAKAKYDTLISQLRLKTAAGTLGDEDVQALNALLE